MARSPPRFLLRPCRTTSHAPLAAAAPLDALDGAESEAESRESGSILVPERKEQSFDAYGTRGVLGGRKVSILKHMKKGRAGGSSSSSSSAASRTRKKGGGGGGEEYGGAQELGLPLGMSFAAVIAQILEKKHSSEEVIPADRLSTICVSAVKEAVANVFGEKYEHFLRNFERSFFSTMKTLQAISGESITRQENSSHPPSSSQSESLSSHGEPQTWGCKEDIKENQSQTSEYIEEIQMNPAKLPEYIEDNQGSQSSNEENQIIILNGPSNQQLMPISNYGSGQALSQAILATFEKSVVEQTRSNELKTVELGLTLQRMEMKKSQLSLSYCSNILEQAKVSLGLKEIQFKEEKLKSQMQDLKHAEFLRRCIDFLVAGLFIMSAFLVYAAWVYSYKRIIEATELCTPSPEESKSWWMPKQVSSFNTALLLLRCHVVVLSRMSFGILMILAVAYLLFQRSAGTGPMMPVTFICLILGVVCGVAGKLCIDTLGGDGYRWLMHWETLCFLHLLANSFPSFMQPLLYGRDYAVQKPRFRLLPLWIRRLLFYGALLLVLPTLGGLLPFASFNEWKGHFTELVLMQFDNEYQKQVYDDL